MPEPQYKQIKVKLETYNKISALADKLAADRGQPNSNLQNTVAEAIKFYSDSLEANKSAAA